MGNIQIIEEEYEVESKTIIEQLPVLEEQTNESFKTIIPYIG